MPWHPLRCYLLSAPHLLSMVNLAGGSAAVVDCSMYGACHRYPWVALNRQTKILLSAFGNEPVPASPLLASYHVAAYLLCPTQSLSGS